jgi:ferrous iron transport protein B
MIVVWALHYFPDRDAAGQKYEERRQAIKAPVQDELDELEELEEKLAGELDEIKHLRRKEKRAEGEKKEELRRRREEIEAKIEPSTKRMEELEKATEEAREKLNDVQEEWKRNSLLGRAGRALEPAFAPLGWDWRLTVAALASFPAREVVVGTLGIIYKVGEADAGEIRESDADEVAGSDLGRALAEAKWDDSGRPVFTVPTALSVMVFFALCCQCASTLAVIRRETRSWRWPLFTFTYMTVLAYLGALVTYQVGTHFFS